MSDVRSIAVDKDLLARVLSPYKPNCRYLHSAVVEMSVTDSVADSVTDSGRDSVTGTGYGTATGAHGNGNKRHQKAVDTDTGIISLRGRLSIPSSCYIDDTGHFNSVEFNLCYNQLVYALMAQCVVSGLLPAFERMTLDEYLARQLPDVLIHEFSSKFRRPMDVADFEGRVSILEAADRRRFLLLRTHCEFQDGRGGNSHGDISLAIVNRGDVPARDRQRTVETPLAVREGDA